MVAVAARCVTTYAKPFQPTKEWAPTHMPTLPSPLSGPRKHNPTSTVLCADAQEKIGFTDAKHVALGLDQGRNGTDYKAIQGTRWRPRTSSGTPLPLFPSSPLLIFPLPFPLSSPVYPPRLKLPPSPPFGPHLRRLNLEGNCTHTQTTTTTTTKTITITITITTTTKTTSTNVQESEETSQQMYDKMNEQMNALYKKHDCSPMKSVVAMMFQAPIMISVFLSLRKMAGTYPSMMTGGAFWFTVSCH